MSRKRKKQKPLLAGNQCDACDSRYCRDHRRERCGRLEFDAIAAGERYECPDYEAGYWERMEAA